MHAHRDVALALLVLVLLALASSAQATQIRALDITELSKAASLVVEGRVVDQHSHWNADRTHIFTTIEIEVDRTHKGAPADRVAVVQAGGEVDGMKMTVHGITTWRLGEEVLAFLEPSPMGGYRTSGFSQGKFTLLEEPGTGRRVALRAALGVDLVGASDGGAGLVRLDVDQVLQRAGLQVTEGDR